MKKKSFLRNADMANVNDYVKNGELYENAPITAVMIESSSDLDSLEGLQPGSVAYVAGFTSMWQLGADGEWAVVV